MSTSDAGKGATPSWLTRDHPVCSYEMRGEEARPCPRPTPLGAFLSDEWMLEPVVTTEFSILELAYSRSGSWPVPMVRKAKPDKKNLEHHIWRGHPDV